MITVPPSKSLTHRALICAALAHGKSILINPLVCDDTLITADVLNKLGIKIEKFPGRWIVHGGTFQTPKEELFCNESGTTFRFITALTSAFEIPCRITGKPSLIKRGAVPSNEVSSQYVSGMLLARPESKKEVEVSKPYVELTLAVQKTFGVDTEKGLLTYKPTTFVIEGDWSSAAFLLAAGVLKKEVALTGLNPSSLQPDRAIVTILKEMGADVQWQGDTLVAKKSNLKAIGWDFTDTPDLFPIVCILSACAKGKSQFSGTERLLFKESNRPEEIKKVLENTLIDSRDHRIIMAAAVLGLAKGVAITFSHPEAVGKSFPNFWEIYEQYSR